MAVRAAPVAAVLLLACLLRPADTSGTGDIVAAVKQQAAKVQGAIDLVVNGGHSAEPLAGGATLGVKGTPLKQHRYSKKCGTHMPTAKELASVQPVMDAAVKLEAEEDVARFGAASCCIFDMFGSYYVQQM